MRRTAICALVLGAFALGFAGASALQGGGLGQALADGHADGHGDDKKHGGDDEKPGGGDGGEMAHPEPLNDPHLDRLVGTWEWTGKMWMAGNEMPMKSTEKIEWVLGHQFLMSRYESYDPEGNVVFEGIGITRSNPEEGKHTTWWFDVHGMPQTYHGTLEGETVTSTWEGPQGKSRSIVTVKEDGTAHAKMASQPPGQTEWVPFFDVQGKKQ